PPRRAARAEARSAVPPRASPRRVPPPTLPLRWCAAGVSASAFPTARSRSWSSGRVRAIQYRLSLHTLVTARDVIAPFSRSLAPTYPASPRRLTGERQATTVDALPLISHWDEHVGAYRRRSTQQSSSWMPNGSWALQSPS